MEGKDNILSQNTRLKIAIFGNKYQEEYLTQLSEFFNLMSHYDLEVAMEYTFYNYLSRVLDTTPHVDQLIKGDRFTADIALSIGGDGTFLRTAQRVADKEIPIIGINTGRLGFLASFSPDSIEETIEDIYAGRFNVEQHSVLQISCDEFQLKDYPCALNEIAILKHDISSMISIHTDINNEHLTTYQADGLIISTPTGSTAYSLSVGGPIIVPQSDTICITPVAPHSLNMRPIVLCDNSEITLKVESRSSSFLISLDGRSQSYPDNIHLRIHKAPYCINVITRQGQSFYTTLRRKMMWGADSRA